MGRVWEQWPSAEALVVELVDDLLGRSPRLTALGDALRERTGTRLFDWVDHVVVDVAPTDLTAVGYVDGWRTPTGVWRHPAAQLPAVVPSTELRIVLRVDDAAAFAELHGHGGDVHGRPGGGLRLASTNADGVDLVGAERRSWASGVDPDDGHDVDAGGEARRRWAERPRHRADADAVHAQRAVAVTMVDLAGPDLAASYALDVERAYWQRRNRAAALQFARQDAFALGWGNRDHHTFRSSRAAFAPLLAVFAALGFEQRERFFAGAEAGWGAQVLEHPGTGDVLFADVDLLPGEEAVDFSVAPLPAADGLGTVGLWCALHGESILAAGMHHLEGQFDFDLAREQLTAAGIRQLAPFSSFDYLRQAFTDAERWPVDHAVLDSLVADGLLNSETAERFRAEGAAGSHLEVLQRGGGFKGFNQHNVSVTMRATDPRTYATVD